MKKKIPEQLARRQEQQRQETINKIMWALDELESMGMDETLRNLMALTGLSHSVFYKPHVKEFIAGYCPRINQMLSPQIKFTVAAPLITSITLRACCHGG